MSKRDVILFFFKWKYSLVGYFLLVVAVTTLLVYLLPQKYNAMSSVLVESNRAPVMRSDMAFGTNELTGLNSAIAIIQSNTVLSMAIDKVGPSKNNEVPSSIEIIFDEVTAWLQEVGLSEPLTPRAALIRRLENKLRVEPLANSTVITISLKGKNPEWIAEIINAVTDSYIEHHIKIFSSTGTSEVYYRQVDRLKKELEERQKEMADYKRKSSISALEETQHALVQLRSRLILELAESQEELAKLQTRFSQGHTQIQLSQKKVSTILGSLPSVQSKLQNLEAQKAKIEEMGLGITFIKKSYQEYQKRYEEERLNDLANPDVVNVRVIEYASVPMLPKHSRIFYIAIATIGGFILSLGIALIREYFDHRVSDPDAVAKILGIPTLGSVRHTGGLF